MKKDLLFALELASKVIGSFIFMTYIGMKLSEYLNNKIFILICLIISFLYVMKVLIGVGRKWMKKVLLKVH